MILSMVVETIDDHGVSFYRNSLLVAMKVFCTCKDGME